MMGVRAKNALAALPSQPMQSLAAMKFEWECRNSDIHGHLISCPSKRVESTAGRHSCKPFAVPVSLIALSVPEFLRRPGAAGRSFEPVRSHRKRPARRACVFPVACRTFRSRGLLRSRIQECPRSKGSGSRTSRRRSRRARSALPRPAVVCAQLSQFSTKPFEARKWQEM